MNYRYNPCDPCCEPCCAGGTLPEILTLTLVPDDWCPAIRKVHNANARADLLHREWWKDLFNDETQPCLFSTVLYSWLIKTQPLNAYNQLPHNFNFFLVCLTPEWDEKTPEDCQAFPKRRWGIMHRACARLPEGEGVLFFWQEETEQMAKQGCSNFLLDLNIQFPPGMNCCHFERKNMPRVIEAPGILRCIITNPSGGEYPDEIDDIVPGLP